MTNMKVIIIFSIVFLSACESPKIQGTGFEDINELQQVVEKIYKSGDLKRLNKYYYHARNYTFDNVEKDYGEFEIYYMPRSEGQCEYALYTKCAGGILMNDDKRTWGHEIGEKDGKYYLARFE